MKIQQLKRTHSYNNIHQSGRSMVEMLGVLAIIGVLLIVGIMGYRYAMDKYRANTIIHDVMLRSMDVIAQIDATGKAHSDKWPKITIGDYEIGLEDNLENDDVTSRGIFVKGLPENLCSMVFLGLINRGTIKMGDTLYDSLDDIPNCQEDTPIVFYIDGISNRENNDDENIEGGENGEEEEEVTSICPNGLEWFDSVGECRLPNGCPEDYPALRPYCGETVCKKCEAPAYLKDGECVCEGIYLDYGEEKDFTCELCDTTSTYAEDGKCKCRPGYIRLFNCYPHTKSCEKCISPAYEENGVCKCPEGYIKPNLLTCFKCPDNSTPNAQNTGCECDNGKTIAGGTCENPALVQYHPSECTSPGVPCTLPDYESCIYPAEN